MALPGVNRGISPGIQTTGTAPIDPMSDKALTRHMEKLVQAVTLATVPMGT